MNIPNTTGHTTELGPHAAEISSKEMRELSDFAPKFKESREHVLLLLILLFFSANIALAFVHFQSASTAVDSTPPPDFMASLGNFLSI